MHYSGAVYRPPSEARSLIVQCTLGCSHNKCAFCTMYKDKKFSINPIEQVLSDLDEARAYGRYIEKIFLADGDALILPMDYLLTVLDYIRDHFPTCKRVAAYATTKAIMRKTDEELRTLREHGLGIVYIGLESGNEELLKKFCKGVTAEEIVLNAIRCKQAGIATSVTAINGMAGANGDWQAHAIDTAKAVSRMKPDYIAFLTLRVYSGTPLHDWIASGEFKMMEPPELMRETRLFLEHIDSDGSIFRSNHASNYLPLGGTLNRDREALIQTIDAALDGKVLFLPASEAMEAVKTGQVDVAVELSSIPSPQISELSILRPVHILEFLPGARADMMQKYPQYLPTTIEKGAYNGIDQPIETVGTGAMFACRADLPDDLVYEIVKTVYSQEGVDYLGNVIAALKSMSPNLAVSYKPIPLHPGAERYFREIGLIKD